MQDAEAGIHRAEIGVTGSHDTGRSLTAAVRCRMTQHNRRNRPPTLANGCAA